MKTTYLAVEPTSASPLKEYFAEISQMTIIEGGMITCSNHIARESEFGSTARTCGGGGILRHGLRYIGES